MTPLYWCIFVGLAILVALGIMVWLQVRTKPDARSPQHPLDQTLEVIRKASTEERVWLAVIAFCARTGRGVAVAIIVATVGITGTIAAAICGMDWVLFVDAVSRAIHRYRCDSVGLTPGQSVPEVCRS